MKIKPIIPVVSLMASLSFSVNAQSSETVSYSDPWESMNRVTDSFNHTLDAWVLRPVASSYNQITPKPVQHLVSNFFQNLSEVRNFGNSLLQFEIREAGETGGRFVVNSTVGMLGLLDVASEFDLEYNYQDFGLTLGHWNIPSGPYVVVPFFGPRTVRSAAGFVPDNQLSPIQQVNDSQSQLALQTSEVVDLRTQLLSQESLIVGDRYTFIRDAYLQRRDYLLTGEINSKDDF
ncbi:VacJ family lipoprotein [Parendozoicomonas sp. Alg238-R29]|uniref:MlaA family lipoprotein n=1 Tax=Parendozoicomonas sp. Alg238-R29 TaxID=2993446 RepID=UPI00248E260B|nr:VacJ family lipoprotein [Parendozoicomonas sp. Alg238-R29]